MRMRRVETRSWTISSSLHSYGKAQDQDREMVFQIHVPVNFRVIFNQTDTATFDDPHCARIALCLTLAPPPRTDVHEHVPSATFRIELKKAPGEPQRIEFKYTELMEDNRLVVTIFAAEWKKAFKRKLVGIVISTGLEVSVERTNWNHSLRPGGSNIYRVVSDPLSRTSSIPASTNVRL